MEAKMEKLNLDLDEFRKLLDLSSRQRVKDAISVEIRRVETEITNEREKLQKQTAAANGTTVSAVSAAAGAKTYDVQIKQFSWDQSDNFVKIYLTGLNGVQQLPKEEVTHEFTESSVNVRIGNLNGKNHLFSIRETNDSINPEKSSLKVKSDLVLLMLAKSPSGKKWEHLTAADSATAKSKVKAPSVDEKADPSASLMTMMKQMYDEGDDDMKRTIAKAWSESRDKNPGQNPLDL